MKSAVSTAKKILQRLPVKNSKALIIPILIISLVINVIVALTSNPASLKAGDSIGYNNIGLNIASGKGFSLDGQNPTAHREPAYPGFIAIIYLLFGYHQLAVKLVQGLIGVVIVFLIFLIGESIFNRRIALSAAFLTAIWLPLALYYGYLLTEALFTFALVVSAYCLLKLKEHPTIWMAVLCGLALSVGVLTRVTLLLIPLFILVGMLITFSIWKVRTVLLWCVLLITMMSPVCLWIVRCYITQGKFILLTSHAHVNLYSKVVIIEHGFKEGVAERSAEEHRIINEERDRRDKLNRNIKNPLGAVIRELILNHPKEYFLSSFDKFLFFWQPFTRTSLSFIKQDSLFYTLFLPVLFIYASALIGMGMTFLHRNLNSGSMLISLFIIYLTAIHSLTHAIPRYRRPIMPFVILLAFYGFFTTLDYLSRRAKLNQKGTSVTSVKSFHV